MSKIKYALIYNYNRNGKLKSNGTAAIYIRAYLNGKNRYFNTDIYITPKQWDERNKRVVQHCNQYQLNDDLRKQLGEMEAYEYEISKNGGIVTLQNIGDYKRSNTPISFTDFANEQLEQSVLSKDTYTDQRQSLLKLQEYKPVVYFHELNYRLINGFNSFLSHKKGLSINTVAKHHKNLKKYIYLAIQYDYLDVNKNPYKKFKVKREPTSRLFLTEQELLQLETLIIPKEQQHLELIKDFFLFCCYTGLRFSDASNITKENLDVLPEGVELYLVAKKTKKAWNYNLRKLFRSNKSEESKPEIIIKKYLQQHLDFYGDSIIYNDKPLFKGFTNQYINRELKNLAQLLNIRTRVKEKISMHVARHTFATIMVGKVRPHILQELLQHSKIKETMIYVHLDKNIVGDALDNVNW